MVFISSLVCKGLSFYGAPFRYFRRNRSWYDCFALLMARRSVMWMKMTPNTNYTTEQNSLFLTVSPVV